MRYIKTGIKNKLILNCYSLNYKYIKIVNLKMYNIDSCVGYIWSNLTNFSMCKPDDNENNITNYCDTHIYEIYTIWVLQRKKS